MQSLKGLFIIYHNVFSAPEFTPLRLLGYAIFAVYGQHFESMLVGSLWVENQVFSRDKDNTTQ